MVYTISAYTPFTKILSASINQDKTDIQSRINWAGGTDATTGLGDDNLQSNAASGGGLTRSTKLKKGTANYAVYNDVTGAMTEGVALPLLSGGTGASLVLTNPGDVLQVNSAGTAIVSAVPSVPNALRIYSFYRFS